MDVKSVASPKMGRPQAIPPEAFGLVFRLYGEGLGYRAIADRLSEMGVCYSTKSSIERCLKGKGCYAGRRVTVEHGSGGLADGAMRNSVGQG